MIVVCLYVAFTVRKVQLKVRGCCQRAPVDIFPNSKGSRLFGLDFNRHSSSFEKSSVVGDSSSQRLLHVCRSLPFRHLRNLRQLPWGHSTIILSRFWNQNEWPEPYQSRSRLVGHLRNLRHAPWHKNPRTSSIIYSQNARRANPTAQKHFQLFDT